ncbi:hypothetical protein IW245_005681 [Longispora fulva]|uniref:Uncharacterized protein n=1 Tax=Longispora fulva TaxID=619741 RepID=A0A8J7KYN1_9ACTN|nr:hypothetical protein [Longispora fulva]
MARELKYSSPTTDFEKLQRELAGGDPQPAGKVDDLDEDEDDPWAPTQR